MSYPLPQKLLCVSLFFILSVSERVREAEGVGVWDGTHLSLLAIPTEP